jgi:hypothetical protein
MGVTRIRYLLDQWRLRSVLAGLEDNLPKEKPRPRWEVPGPKEAEEKRPPPPPPQRP